jgi:YVTN family beta-propeller protein
LTKRATSDSGITATGMFVGTLDYAAPEQFEGRAVDGRADVYSLGCVLYECLTGEVPFPKENQAALVYAHLHAPPPKVTAAKPGLPPAIDQVVATAMAKKAQDRYAYAGDLASAAADALGVHPVTPTTPTRPLGPPSRARRTGFLVGIGAAAVAVVVLLVVLLNGGGKGTPPGAGPTTGAAPAALVDYVARVDLSTGRPSGRIEVGKGPSSVAIAEGSAWIANNGDDTVSRVDPVSGKVIATIDVGDGPFVVAAGEGAVWVASHRETKVWKIDPATNKVTEIDVGIAPRSLAIGEGAIWVAYDPGLNAPDVVILKFDAATGRHLGDVMVSGEDILFPIGPVRPWAMAAGGGSLWTGGFSGRLYQIDARTLRVVGQNTLNGKPINAIWLQGDSPWVGVSGTPGTVFQVDPQSGEVVSTIPAGGGTIGESPNFNQPISGAADDRAVWVTDTLNGTVSQIVILSGQASAPVEVGKVPTGIAIGLGSVWVTVDG